MNIEELQSALAVLETQKELLGEAVYLAATSSLKKQLVELQQNLATPSHMEGERKLLTVMFADISGFTALSEKLDPEQVRRLMNSCFECLVPVVEKYGGVVDKFIGDEIMALFGAPVAFENHAERAMRSALEMQQALDEFNKANKTDLGLHFGISTGTVIAGGIGSRGRQQYSVMGDTVNLGARLEDASERGQIFVSQDTYRLTVPLFEFETLNPIKVKGKHQPIQVYQLSGLKAVPGQLRGINGLNSPLIGRDSEMAELARIIKNLESGKGEIVAIRGEAGLGKSRLVAEVRRKNESPTRWAEGKAYSYTQSNSFWVAKSLLLNLLGCLPDISHFEVEAALWSGVKGLFNGKEVAIYPYLGRLLELPLNGEMEDRVKYQQAGDLKKLIFSAYREFFRASANSNPLVLVWEDLHWADPSSLELLESLVDLAEANPVVFLLAFRPEEEGTVSFSQLLEKRSHRLLELAPLSPSDSARLVENLLKIENMPASTRQLILEKADGNPFFLEELLRSLVEAGLVVVRDESAVAVGEIGELQIPDTLQGVIASRIDRLPAGSKQALQTAAVIGRVFQEKVLRLLYGQNRASAQLDRSLEDLQRREMVRQLEQLEYIFKHAVTQEVAYSSLLVERRRELHRIAGEAIESLFPDRLKELAATLAYHYQRAGENLKAVNFMMMAAQHSATTYALTETLALYNNAIRLATLLSEIEGNPLLVTLHERLGNLLTVAGNREEALVNYKKALTYLNEEEILKQARLLCRIGSTLIETQSKEAFVWLEKALGVLQITQTETDPQRWVQWVEIKLRMAYFYYWIGQGEELNQLLQDLKPYIDMYATPDQQVFTLSTLVIGMYCRKDRFTMSEGLQNQIDLLLKAGRETDSLYAKTNAVFNNGFVRCFCGYHQEAIPYLQEAEKLSYRIGDNLTYMRCLVYLATSFRKLNQIAEARDYIERAYQAAKNLEMEMYRAGCIAHRAWLAWQDGNDTEAKTLAREALETWNRHMMAYPFYGWAGWLLILLCLNTDDLKEALEVAALLLLPVQQKMPEILESLLQQAITVGEEGRDAEARDLLLAAIAHSQEAGYF